MIGEIGGGWQVAMTTLLHERGTLGFALTAALEVMVGKLIELARDRGATPLQRDAIAREWIELQALRYTAYRSLSALMKTGIPGPEGSILKQQWSEAAQRVTKLALELLGPDAQLLADNAPYGGYWQHHAAPQPRQHDRGRHVGDPAQHHRRARARAAEVALMDFAFTPEQEELRAQARAFLAAEPRARPGRSSPSSAGPGVSVAEENGGAGLGFLEEAILFEEMGRALTHAPYWSTVAVTLPALPPDLQAEVARGEASWTLATGPLVPDLDTATRVAYVGGDSIWELEGAEREVLSTNDETRPLGVVSGGEAGRQLASSELLPQLRSRSLTALSLEACGVGARALELAVALRERASPVRQADRHLPGDLASARGDADGARARPLARALRRLVHRRGRRARADRRRVGEVALRRRGRRRLRALDPGARRHRLHLGARPAPALQARALDPGLGGVTARSFAPRWLPIYSTAREGDMQGLTMDYQLNVAAILRRGEQLFGHKTIASRLPDKSWHRYTYADFARRSKQLALALRNELGLVDGDRVATFAWNHHEHLETYIGAPVGGFVTHTLNLRLHPDDLTYIATHAGDRVLIADKTLWPLVEAFKDRVGFEHVVAIGAGETPARRDRLRGAARDGRRGRRSRTATSTSARPRRCVTRAAPPGSRRASSTRIARS